jgi:hypothetical protein
MLKRRRHRRSLNLPVRHNPDEWDSGKIPELIADASVDEANRPKAGAFGPMKPAGDQVGAGGA